MSGYAIKQQIGDGYVDDLEAMLPLVDSEEASARAHLVPFVIMCAAALEAVLNDEIVSWAFTSFPKERYKSAADAALSMSFRGKLDMLVPLITNNEYLIKAGSIEYQNLAKLIRRRNELIHSRSYYQDLDFDLEDYSDDPRPKNGAAMMNAFAKIDSKRGMVTKEECMSYFKSIQALYEKVLYPVDEGRLTDNEMIERNIASDK